MEHWTNRWKTVRWDTLEQEARSDNPAIRMHAIVFAYAVVERAGLLGPDYIWSNPGDVIDSKRIRNNAVHYCIDPSVDEAVSTVKCFHDLWNESSGSPTEDESSTDDSSAEDQPLPEVIPDKVADIQVRETPPEHIEEENPAQLIEEKECLCLSKAQIDEFRRYDSCPIYTLAKLCGATPDLLFSIAKTAGVIAITPLHILDCKEMALICGELERLLTVSEQAT